MVRRPRKKTAPKSGLKGGGRGGRGFVSGDRMNTVCVFCIPSFNPVEPNTICIALICRALTENRDLQKCCKIIV